MSDIFREVEEDVRRERLEKLWKQYGDYIIAFAAVVIVGIAGFKAWQHYQFVQTNKAASAYINAIELSGAGKNTDAAKAFEKIAKEAPSGYAATAKLAEANALLAEGKTIEAVAIYKTIAQSDKTELGDVARMRAAWVLADTASNKELQELLAPLTEPKSAWRFMAREILAYSDFRDGKLKQSQSEYQRLATEPDATSSLRQRAGAMATLLRTGVGNYGTVPKPEEKTGNAAPAVQKGNAKK